MKQQDPSQIFEKHYQEWLTNPERMKNGYEYERTYVEMMQNVEREIFQASVGEVAENKNRKKKSRQVLGK